MELKEQLMATEQQEAIEARKTFESNIANI